MTTTGRGIRWRADLTHCFRGHEFTVENTRYSNKKRYCRQCSIDRHQRKRLTDPAYNRGRTEYMRKWRAKNKERDRHNWRSSRKRKKEWLDTQKTQCSKCGESHVACLDFHHRDPSTKEMLLSVAVSHRSVETLKAEVAKCDILCANCHRILHWNERHNGG